MPIQNLLLNQYFNWLAYYTKSMHFPEPDRNKKPSKSKNDVYYQGNKKNQFNELKAYFKTTLSNPDLQEYKKQVVKKIIIYTTQGIDTSRFYPEMVIASGTKDVVEKKLIFFYLSIYSHYNHDFARMAVNTFTKDSYSPNPHIRALSIRHLSNLRFKGRQQYVMPILKQGLSDFSPIVKKACLMGMTKLITEQNRKKSEPARDQELLNTLYGMLRDSDPHVVCCAVQAINEIEPEGIAISKKLAHYLIKNLQNFEEMQLATILNYLQLYDPKEESEIMEFLNKLDTKIRSQNLSLVLSITKIYLKYAKIQPSLMPQIQIKIKPCLMSFLNSSTPQTQYIALKQIFYIIKKYKTQIYRKQIKKFYLKENQPTYNKLCKIQLMEVNCCKQNFGDVINEFTEYIKDGAIIDAVMEALNVIILRMDKNQAKVIIKTLNETVTNIISKDYICNAAIKTVRTFLRKYPEEFKMFQHTFYTYVRGVSSTSARCAMVQIIGDFGEHIEDAVELIALGQSNIEDELKISLIRANVKLFFKRPIQMLNIITNLFKQILTDEQTRMPVKDYASMLYRGLQTDIESLKKVFLSSRSFSEGHALVCKQLECNTLQIAYMKSRNEWLIDQTKYIELLDQIEYAQDDQNGGGNYQGEISETQQSKTEKNRSVVIFSEDYSKIDPDDIDREFEMPAEEFELYWEQYQIGSSITRMVKQIQLLNQETLEELCRLWGVSVIASMESEENIKQYLYFKLNRGDKVCMELTISKDVETLALMVKTQNQELAGFVSKYVEDFMKLNQII